MTINTARQRKKVMGMLNGGSKKGISEKIFEKLTNPSSNGMIVVKREYDARAKIGIPSMAEFTVGYKKTAVSKN